MKTLRQLNSIAEIYAVLGRTEICRLLDKETNHLTNWLAAGFFPPVTFVAMQAALERRGCIAPARLWRMIEPKRSRAA